MGRKNIFNIKLASAALFMVLVPGFIVTTNIRLVINLPVLYSYGFDQRDIPASTGIDRNDLLLASRQIRDYFNGEVDSIQRNVTQYGYSRDLYNDRELSHMRDVKEMVRTIYRIQQISGVYIVMFAAIGIAVVGRAFLVRLAWSIGLGGVATFGLVMIVMTASIVEFDKLFLVFHEIGFANDLWQLDPQRDNLIAMYPERFFFDATMLVALLTIAEACVASAPLYFLWRKPPKIREPEAVTE